MTNNPNLCYNKYMIPVSTQRFTRCVLPHKYMPPHFIWSWTTDKTKSAVSLINDKYRYDVFNIVTGDLLFQDSKDTLPEAKREVIRLTKDELVVE